MTSTTEELRSQWRNPSDILSLLLLIGGDVVQKAIAQLIGHKIRLPVAGKNGAAIIASISVAPVAFSFGWVAYAFSCLMSTAGDCRLMPTTDFPCSIVTASNGFVRETNSWLLGRILRDHESKFPAAIRPVTANTADGDDDTEAPVSLRIDVFTLGPPTGPKPDLIWWLGWVTILAQFAIAIPAWTVYDDWGVMLVVLSGNILAALTCALPQWSREKWPGRVLNKPKTMCLSRGNGSKHVMVFVGDAGSWDLESFAMGQSVPSPFPGTRWVTVLLAILWTGLLISVSGLNEYAWFLVAIGGLGMVQNVVAAGITREAGALGLHFVPFSRCPTIIGRRQNPYQDVADGEIDLDETAHSLAEMQEWAISDQAMPTKNGLTTTSIPKWLNTMTREDGAPEWMEAIKPTAAKASPSRTGRGQGETGDGGVVYATGVHGALMELEKWVPKAGLAMVQVFFPSGLSYDDTSIRDNVHKRFWKRAYYTAAIREKAEARRRGEEQRATGDGL